METTETETIASKISEHPFLKELKPHYLDLVADCERLVFFDAEAIIFKQGEPAHHFYLISYGRVAIDIPAPQAGAITIQTLEEGDVFGWSWLFPPYRWQFDARAIERTEAICMDGRCLRGKCDNEPALGYEFMKRFSAVIQERLQASRIQLLDVYGQTAMR